MNEAKLRRTVHGRLIRHFHRNPAAQVVDELGLFNGRYRIDIAAINGRLYGYELKSNLDDLSRLPDQAKAYSKVFSRVTLVVAERLLPQALHLIPDWWGVAVASPGPKGGINLERARHAASHNQLDPISIAQLLWRNEASGLVQAHRPELKLAKAPRRELYRQLSVMLTVEELQQAVARTLRARRHWRDPSQS